MKIRYLIVIGIVNLAAIVMASANIFLDFALLGACQASLVKFDDPTFKVMLNRSTWDEVLANQAIGGGIFLLTALLINFGALSYVVLKKDKIIS